MLDKQVHNFVHLHMLIDRKYFSNYLQYFAEETEQN